MKVEKIAKVVYNIPTARIEPDPEQPRKEIDPEYIKGLGESIKAEGLLHPITVRVNPDKKDYYLIVAGECRWRAHCSAGLPTVECSVSKRLEEDNNRFRAQFMENKARANMSLRDEANAALRLQKMGDSLKVIARASCETVSRVKALIALTKLSEDVWKLLAAGEVNEGIACWAVLHVEEKFVEQLLIAGAGKSRAQANAIIQNFLNDQAQTDFALVMEAAGIAQTKVNYGVGIAKLAAEGANMIEKLSPKQQSKLAIKIGNEIAEIMQKNKRNRNSVQFITKVCHHLSAVLE